MAGKKVTPMSSTPPQSYPQPWWNAVGDIYGDPFGGTENPSMGPMGRSPAQGGVWNTPSPSNTPMANPAAVRAYTRNAPYMEEFMSSPQTMMQEIMRLRQELADKPGDPVNEYRLRMLTQALGDVFGMGEKDARATAATTPMSAPSYLGMRTTGER